MPQLVAFFFNGVGGVNHRTPYRAGSEFIDTPLFPFVFQSTAESPTVHTVVGLHCLAAINGSISSLGSTSRRALRRSFRAADAARAAVRSNRLCCCWPYRPPVRLHAHPGAVGLEMIVACWSPLACNLMVLIAALTCRWSS